MFGLGNQFGGAEEALGGYGGMDGDAGAQGGMGGYLASQTQNPNQGGDGQQRPGGGGGNGGYGVFMSVTCKLILDAAKEIVSMDSKTTIHGQKVEIVNLVAQVHSGTDLRADPSSDKLEWMVTDGTGMVRSFKVN